MKVESLFSDLGFTARCTFDLLTAHWRLLSSVRSGVYYWKGLLELVGF